MTPQEREIRRLRVQIAEDVWRARIDRWLPRFVSVVFTAAVAVATFLWLLHRHG